MPQTFQQLQTTPSKEDLLLSIIALLQGIGLTTHSGFSPGGVTLTGVPPDEFDFRVKIITAGNLGAAEYQYSDDGGASWSATATVPADGLVALPGPLDPLILTFADGPDGLESFEVDDEFQVLLTIPIWPLTSWQALAAGRTLLELDAAVLEDFYLLLYDISAGGFVEHAEGPWLDLLAWNLYRLTRTPGLVTQGNILLSDLASAGPFNLVNGDVVFESLDGLKFILSADVTVVLDGTAVVAVRAEQKGARYNVGNNTITRFTVAVPGLTVNNPIFADGTWVTTAGSDDESNDSLKLRCINQWATLGVGLPAPNYDTWAKAADASVTRTFARVSPTVAGQVDLFIAGAAGAVGAPVIAAVQTYVDPRVALTNTCLTASVTNFAQTITATVYCYEAFLATATAQVTAALTALLNVKKGIGATLYLSEIYDTIQTVLGVHHVDLTVPAANVALTASQVFVFTNNLSFVGI